MTRMTRARRWLAGLALAFALLLLAVVLALWAWLPSGPALASKVAQELTSALGVKVTVGGLRWQLLPLPAISLSDVATAQPQPVTVKKLTLYPNLTMLYQRSLSFDLAELDGAVVPQLSLRALGRNPGGDGAPGGWVLAALPLERFVFRNVTWMGRRGIPVVYDGEVDFEARWRPSQAQLRLPGANTAAELSLVRQGMNDQWRVNINLGGGTAHGEVQLQTQPNGRLQLDGKLKPREIEVASALTAFNRRPVIAGTASGDSTLSASGVDVMALAQSLHTQTLFAISPATLLRFDLGKAVRSAGKDHTGQTPLDTVAGQMDTQNGPSGMAVSFSNIKARSGALSASGNAVLANQHIEAEFAVDLVDGVVGVPLKVSGPTDRVVVTVPGGAIAGAVVGTALLPGVGTAIGARVGAALGKLFGSSPAPLPAPSSASPRSSGP